MPRPSPTPGERAGHPTRRLNPPPHNLKHPLYKIRFFILRLFFVASFPKISYTKKTGRARVYARTVPDHKSPSLERRPMADTDSSSAPNSSSVPKPHIYDLLNRLNASFARVHRNMAALEEVGIFDPLMMQALNRQSEQLRAGANYHLLGAMRRIEERDRERFSQPPKE